MADLDKDIRTKVDADTHAVFSALSQITGDDIAALTRRVLTEFAAKEIHRGRTVLAAVRDYEGINGSARE